MRDYFENLEESLLAPYASKSVFSYGRTYDEKPSSTRTCFQRDRDRIVHSKSFRRLKDKTQVFIANVSDHYRSRLTHTIEVAQISRHLARLLRLNEDLSECIALAHDLGHSPFGHSGEDELNALLKNSGGFEHNLHSLRLVEEIEQKYPMFPGLNLSYEVKEGLKKHETPWDSPNQQHAYVTLEAQVANIADEIAYNNHDIDDGLSAGILDINDLIKHVELFKEASEVISKEYSNLQHHERAHLINSHIISEQVMNVFHASCNRLEKLNLKHTDDLQSISDPIIAFDKRLAKKNDQLRSYLYTNFYQSPSIVSLNNYGKDTINIIFSFLLSKPEFVPTSFLNLHYQKGYSRELMIGYFIAGMTDNYASRFCQIHGLNK